MSNRNSFESRDGVSEFEENTILLLENDTNESKSDHEQSESFHKILFRLIKIAITTFYNINYSLCITAGLIFGILSFIFSDFNISIHYEQQQLFSTLCSGTVFQLFSMYASLYIALTLVIQSSTSYLLQKGRSFSYTTYTIYSIADNISIIILGITSVLISYYYDKNLTIVNNINFNLSSHDIMGLVILGNLILAFMTGLVKFVSFDLNRDTFMERMLMVFKVDYFLNLLKIIKTNSVNKQIEKQNLWEYAFPWIGADPKLSDYQTEEYTKKKELFFTENINQISPDMRDWIYKEFKKQPYSILFGAEKVTLQNTDLNTKRIDKFLNENVKTVKDM